MFNQKQYTMLLITLFIISGSGKTVCAQETEQVRAEPAWNLLMKRTEGWTGADCAGSVLLPGKRALWLFADTWIGDVENNAHKNAKLVNNTIGIHSFDASVSREAPKPEQIKFFWGEKVEGKPTAWVIPPLDQSKEEKKQHPWYWTTGGSVLLPSSDGEQKLAIFLFEMRKSDRKGSVWNFESNGGGIAIIDNVQRPVNEWQPRILDLSHNTSKPQAIKKNLPVIDWGLAAIQSRDKKTKTDYVYIYGVGSEPGKFKQLVLARVEVEKFEKLSTWRFFGKDGAWVESSKEAVSLITGVPNELSVERISSKSGKELYVMVHSAPLLGDGIFIRTADGPVGPWSKGKKIYTVPDVKSSKNYFTYAAKGHYELSPAGRLLISYVVNSNNFGEMFRDTSIYRPKFFSVPLEMIFEP